MSILDPEFGNSFYGSGSGSFILPTLGVGCFVLNFYYCDDGVDVVGGLNSREVTMADSLLSSLTL